MLDTGVTVIRENGLARGRHSSIHTYKMAPWLTPERKIPEHPYRMTWCILRSKEIIPRKLPLKDI